MTAPLEREYSFAATGLAHDELAARLVVLRRELAACPDLASAFALLGRALPPLLPARDRVSLALPEPDADWMRFYRLLPAVEGVPDQLPRVRVEGTVVGHVARTGSAQVVSDVRADKNITFGHASHDGIRSTASVPVTVAGRVVAVFNAGSRRVDACHVDMLEHLVDVALVVAPALLALEAPRVATVPASGSREPAQNAGGGEQLLGASPAFLTLLGHARRAAASDAPVLITGETGVGKSALARAIHGWSRRSARPFAPVHLADLPGTLIESELFGHERGAFTGATQRRQGRFELADGGTLFLDEIGETPLPVQAKLLRVVQDGRFERVGGTATLRTDVRIITATHRDLRACVADGDFRQDLRYRLEILPLHVPALRERPEDLELIARRLVEGLCAQVRRPLRLSPLGWRRLRAHGWPGNIRELESVLLRASVLEEGPELELLSLATGDVLQAVPRLPSLADWPSADEAERRYLRSVLEHTGGRIEGRDGAARLLELQPSTLRSRLKRLGLDATFARPGRS